MVVIPDEDALKQRRNAIGPSKEPFGLYTLFLTATASSKSTVVPRLGL